MKKIFLLAAMVCSMVAMAQQPVITFDKTTHDFGKINEADGRVTTVFEFTNEGMVPLVLTNVRASCGCTTPKWTREPIEPGAKGNITVTYNPNGRPGRFQKTVTVTSNAAEATTKLYIKGEVIPKPTQPTEQYPIAMGKLRLKKKVLNFGPVVKGGNKMLNIEYANTTDKPMTVDLLTRDQDNYFAPQVTKKDLQPNETGKIQIALQSSDCQIYGPVEATMYVMVNGEKKLTDEFAITLKADLKENFSKMTVEERQQAPIVEYAATTNLGTIKAGKKIASKITLSNVGLNPLVIRRVISNDNEIHVYAPKSAIKGGKKADLKFDLNTVDMKAGTYARVITVITNDPTHSVIRLRVEWVVE
jgi:hypothetical protein